MATGDELKARLRAYITERQAEIDAIQASAKVEVDRLQGQIAAAKQAAALWTPETNTLIAFLQSAGIKLD